MSLCLRVIPGNPGETPFEHRCDADVVIGRSRSAGVSIPSDRFLSKRHARVFEDVGAWYIEDLDSLNTTLLNGSRVTERTRVFEGDVILVSDCRIEVSFVPSAEDGNTLYRPAATVLEESDSKERIHETPGEPALKRYAERLALLNEVHRALAEQMSRDELLELILERAFTHLRAEEGTIFLEGDDGEFFRAVSRRKSSDGGESMYSRHLLNVVAKQGMAALVHDVQQDERFSEANSLVLQGIRSIVAAPLPRHGARAGMIALATRAVMRSFTEADMELLVSLASVAALRLRNLELHEEAVRRERLERELELARRIQVALFPSTLPDVPGYQLYASNRPSRTVSGDLYRIEIRENTGECVILVADVSGKGISASLLTASLEALAMGPIEMGRSPEEICDKVSRRLHARTPPERYATAFLAALVPETGGVRYANAGHNPALVVRADGSIEELWATGLPLGMMADATFTGEEISLSPGDTLVAYTDGVTEAKNAEGEEFQLERLKDACRRHRAESAEALARSVSAELDAFTGAVAYEDDRTIVIARRTLSS